MRFSLAAQVPIAPADRYGARMLHTLIALTLALSAFSSGSFTDDNQSVHEADIEAIAAAGITRGCNPPLNDHFCPDARVTRGEMAAFLSRALELPQPPTDFFSDDNGDTFETQINAVAAADITRGCDPPSNRYYCPGRSITRAEMASMLTRAFDLPLAAINRFVDDEGTIHESANNALAAAGVTTGCNPPANNQFCPDAPVTRGQMASFLSRALGLAPIEPPATASSYWEWGWGFYNHDVPVEVQAAFDWSTVNFGTVHPGPATIDRLNQILAVNPDHKFLVRVWPNPDIGDRPDLPTMFHYLYEPGMRERVLEETREQVSVVLDGLNKPENILGFTFLEELPFHWTSHHATLGWQRGQQMPPDIAQFEAQINTELGEPFDMGIDAHRLWWGSKYSETISEIHATIKEASGGLDVFVWQQTGFGTLDMLQPGESMFQPNVIPIHYSDIVKPGLVDGIFGYPNNDAIWQTKTLNIAEELDVPFWSQLSTPGFMRIVSWEETLELARQQYDGNLGTLIYSETSTGAGFSNRMPYEDGVTVWTVEDHARKLAEMLLDR